MSAGSHSLPTATDGTEPGGACSARVYEPGRQHGQHAQPQVIESSGDLPWSEFCGTIEEPVFLLPITGFADL